MASKKIKKAIIAGLAGVAGAKMLGSMGAAKKAIPVVDTGDLGSEMANDTALASSMRKNMEAGIAAKKAAADSSVFGKVKNFLSNEIFTTDPKTKMRLPKRGPVSSEMFGLGPMDGAKYGKMIKASNGKMVMSRGCKLGKNKPTKLS